jgi:predicted aspartyl protease
VIVAGLGGDFHLLLRPEIEVSIQGPSGSATYIGLVDTGSDNTIFPKSIADDLGISLEKAPTPASKTFGGHSVELLVGEAVLRLEASDDVVAWRTLLNFYDFPEQNEEAVILGHAGFLDYFTATFDGKDGLLTLVPNDELPQAE